MFKIIGGVVLGLVILAGSTVALYPDVLTPILGGDSLPSSCHSTSDTCTMSVATKTASCCSAMPCCSSEESSEVAVKGDAMYYCPITDSYMAESCCTEKDGQVFCAATGDIMSSDCCVKVSVTAKKTATKE